MAQKVCPRCGAMYDQLKSTTCPACFAKLVVVDDETAEELVKARADVEATPEFQDAKSADDARFQEQTFGAVLGVGCIALLTLAVIVFVVALGVKKYNHRGDSPRPAPTVPRAISPAAALDIDSGLPVTGAALGDVLPPAVGDFRRVSSDQSVTLPGTLTPIFHAVYVKNPPNSFDVYAIPAGVSTAQQNEFRLGVTLSAQRKKSATLVFATQHWRYAVIGENGERFRQSWAGILASK